MELNQGEAFCLTRQALLPFLSSPNTGTPYHALYASDFTQNTTELFSFTFVTSSALTSHHPHLFNLLKQHLMLSRQQLNFLTPDHLSHCHYFLCYLSHSLASRLEHSERGSDVQLLSESVFSQLEAVSLLCGSITEIYRSCNLLSSSRPLSHTPLDTSPLSRLLTDTKTHLLLASYLLASLVPELRSRALQHIHSLWSELLEASVAIFLSHSDLLRLNFSLFPCCSLLELWSLSAALTERMLAPESSGFWISFLPFLLSFTSPEAPSSAPLSSTSSRFQFFWWILLGLARMLPPWLCTNRCWHLCREAISSLVAHSATTSHSPLLFSLWTLIRLSEVWGPSMESAMLLWEGISKKLGESGQEDVSIKNVSDLRYDIINTPQDVQTPLLLSPFEIFLRFLSLQFSLTELPPSECWQPYKGRFYSKLSTRRLQNSSSRALLNLYLLAFVLSYKTDVNDVIDKTSEILIKLLSHASKQNSRNKQLVWECLCGLLHVFIERKVSASIYLSRLLPTLGEYHHAAMFDKSCAKKEWEVCSLFWRQIPDMSCCLEQIGAVSVTLRELYCAYYSAFHGEHARQIVVSLNQLVSGAHVLVSENTLARPACRDICSFLWEYGYPAWKQEPLPYSESQELGSLIGNLVLLSLISECELRLSVSEVAKQVLFSDTLACPTGSNFVRTLLCDEVGMRYISQNQVVSQLVIKAWVLYIIQASRYPQFEPYVVSFTRELSVLPPLQMIDTRQASSLGEVVQVLDSLLQHLTTLPPTEENISRSQFYFSDFLQWIEPLLCDQNSTKECMFDIYDIASSLVRHGSSLIYSRTQPHCILPRLIEYLFLPSHSLAKPPHPSHLECVRRHICSFLSSLCRLRPESDPFIKRKIRQLLSQYFPRFSQYAAGDGQSCPIFIQRPNPFLSLFDACEDIRNGVSGDSEKRLYLLSVIRELFLKLPQQPSSLTPTLFFLQTVVTSSNDNLAASASEHLLFPMLGCLLACNVCPVNKEPPRIRELSQSVIKKIVTSVSSLTGDEASYHKQRIVECIKKFVEVNLSSCHGKVFTTLNYVALLFPEVLTLSLDHFHASLLGLERENPKFASEIRAELMKLETLLHTNKRLNSID